MNEDVKFLLILFFAVVVILFLVFSVLIRGFSAVSIYFAPVDVVGVVLLIILLFLVTIRKGEGE